MAIELVLPSEEMRNEARGDLAVMLTGGGARAAYQVGLVKGLARHFPHRRQRQQPRQPAYEWRA